MKSKYYKKWLAYGGISAVMMGMGLSMMIDAGFVRYENPESWNWIIYGTLALCIFMAGTSFFGEAIYAKLDYKKELEHTKKGD